MEFKTRDIELFGHKLKLYERTAQDVLDLTEFVKNQDNKPEIQLFFAASIVRDSLKPNIKKAKGFKKWQLESLLTVKNLMSSLSINQIDQLSGYVYELEGIDLKKKKNPEEEASQDGKPQTSLSDMPQD